MTGWILSFIDLLYLQANHRTLSFRRETQKKHFRSLDEAATPDEFRPPLDCSVFFKFIFYYFTFSPQQTYEEAATWLRKQ